MKKALAFLALIAILILVVIAVLHKLFSAGTPPSQPTATSTPTTFPTVGTVQAVAHADASVPRAFTSQIQNADQITLGPNVAVQPYALQEWSDENKGGQALMKYDAVSGWQLVNMGGGAWDVPSLEAAGVPRDIAAQLIAADRQANQ